ncbi:unnamed protein product [Lepeophtheirus salmonis]|uniref:(salmon louse) hypothetical protein n=1 Tax=Lepeophtheirus salmonis TaxID=72036 RepID=A0A7R8D404_LEPSM|nr:unnamed protein product [Lepeophtheirus salmonis]CAF3021945.1 unnamed protein product [Lepeophtheirus salmonis]
MVVDLPNGKTTTIAMSQEPQKRYWFGMCPISSTLGNMKWCSGCKIVGYIGKEEQKEDWSNHKSLCKVLTTLRNGKQHWLAEFSDKDSFSKELRKGLDRALNQYEIDMVNHPRRCIKCGSYEQDKLVNCQKCYCVAFCNAHVDAGKVSHEEHCQSLRTALDDHKFEVTSWKPLPNDIEKFFSDDISSLVSQKLPGYRDSELRYLTFLYTCPLTVLHALEETGTKSQAVEQMEHLTLHLVAKAHSLDIIFIGDECERMEFPKLFSYKGKGLQIDERKGMKINYRFEANTLYHDYIKKNSFIEPDAVIALDCGFKFYPSWRESLPYMIRPGGAPLIFTEFNITDTKDNLTLLKNIVPNTRTVIEPRLNAYCSKRPVRCSDSTDNYVPYSVIYTNDYVCAVSL